MSHIYSYALVSGLEPTISSLPVKCYVLISDCGMLSFSSLKMLKNCFVLSLVWVLMIVPVSASILICYCPPSALRKRA